MFSRLELRREALTLLRGGRVPLLPFVGLTVLINLVLSVADTLCSGATYEELMGAGPAGFFVYILTAMISLVLEMGRVEYCARVRRGEEALYSDLFCGFSYVFRFLAVVFLQAFLIAIGLSLFVIPAVFLTYRYRFCLYILAEDPYRGPVEILRQSGWETNGFKAELFLLDLSFFGWSFLSALPLALWTVAAPELQLPAVAEVVVRALLSFPVLLVSFWHTATEMGMREKILELKAAH